MPFAKAKEVHEVRHVKPEHRGWSIARVLGYVSLEQFWTVSLLATAANPIGIAVYAGGLALGTLVIKSEYNYRVKEEHERSRLKEETNARCKILDITKFSNDKELYDQFRSRMINYKTVELLCKEDTSKLSDTEILKRFEEIRKDVEWKITFKNIPQQVSLGRNLINTLNPFKDENAIRCFDIKFDEERCHYEMSQGYEVIKNPKVPSQAKGQSVALEVAEEAKQALQGAKVSNEDAARSTGDIKEVQKRLQVAKVEGERVFEHVNIDEAQENVSDAVQKGFVDKEERRKRKHEAKKQRTQ